MLKMNNKKRIKNLLAQINNTFLYGYAKIPLNCKFILAYSTKVSQDILDENINFKETEYAEENKI